MSARNIERRIATGRLRTTAGRRVGGVGVPVSRFMSSLDDGPPSEAQRRRPTTLSGFPLAARQRVRWQWSQSPLLM